MFRSEFAVDGTEEPCEDLIRIADGAAWVLDGTSGFSDRSFTDAASDGRWYVETIDSQLCERIHDGDDLEFVLADAIEATARELATRVPDDASESIDSAVKQYELPACTVSMVRWNDDSFEYLSLCDASVTYQLARGGVREITSSGVLDLVDAETQRLRAASKRNGDGQYEAVVEYIRETRAYANTPGGYWVAQLNPLAAEFASTGILSTDDVEAVLLASDGLDPIVTHDSDTDNGGIQSLGDALAEARTEGVSTLVDRVRRAEAAAAPDGGTPHRDDIAVVLLDG